MPVIQPQQSFFSLSPLFSNFNTTQNSHSSVNDKIGKTTITDTSFITRF
jgi:hypothetical protein